MKKNLFLLTALFLLNTAFMPELFAGPDSGNSGSRADEASEKNNASHTDNIFALKNWDFFFTLGPMVYVNTDSKSAPSPIMFGGGLGFEFFNNHYINFQPKFTFFTNYYLWDGKNARPAEIENRTALALSCLLDLDASHTWIFEKNALQAGAGISFLGRFGLLANGVDESEKDSVKSINSWYYQSMNFLYPNIAVSWMRKLDSKWHAGFEGRIYIPLGAIADGRGFDTMIATLGVKVCSK